MSMGYERSGIAVVPQASWESLLTDNAPANHRCRECAGFADPTATHSDCTIRGGRKCGYAGACKKRIPRVITITPTRKDMSMIKHHDVPNAWTPEEDATLREFGHEGVDAVAARLGRGVSGTQQRASKLHVSLAKRKTGTSVVDDADMTPAAMIAAIAEDETCPDSLDELEEDAASIATAAGGPVSTWNVVERLTLAARVEAEADEFAEAVATGALLAIARAEIAELRIELMMLALTDKLGDDAESFASEYIFPAIGAAENAAEVAA